MQKTCKQCHIEFKIDQWDQEFYKKMEVPEPKLCPDCRQQRRLAQGNQMHLYKRKCDFSGKPIISNFHQDSPYKVYDQVEWYSDKWDATEYGQEYDFDRPFFEQLQELSLKVPRPSLQTGFEFDENSPYTNYAGKNKNCYFIFDSDENRDCYYSYSLNQCNDCSDCYRVRNSELCFECIDCFKCYNSQYLQNCENCSDSMFLKNCIGMKKSIGCVNMKNKEYYIWNKQSTKEEYEKLRDELKNHSARKKFAEKFHEFQIKFPQRFMRGVQNENVVGEYLDHSKNAHYCFDCSKIWDCKYCFQAFMPLKDSMDTQECGEAELVYETAFVGYDAFNIKFSAFCLSSCADQEYSMYCPHSKNVFGCIGVRRRQYCILNKQYTQEEYEELIPKIKEHMKSTEEYGEFFPVTMSAFGYNETLAQEHYPLSKEQAIKQGFNWRDQVEETFPDITNKIEGKDCPETIDEVNDEIVHWAIADENNGKLFRIQKAELDFYRKMDIPLSHEHFLTRHERRRQARNPRKIWNRNCDKCNAEIGTSYEPTRPERVYCEKCYQQSLD